MIRCAVCQGRVRPPARPWTTAEGGGVSFYRTDSDMDAYAKELGRLAKQVAFVHEACAENAAPGTLPKKCVIALDLNTRLRQQQRRGVTT